MRILRTAKRVLPHSALKAVGRPAPPPAFGSTDSDLLDAVAHALLCDDTAEPNLVVLSGEVCEPPVPVQGNSPQAALHLTLDHPAPDERASKRMASTSVEVPGGLLASYAGKIEMGDSVLVVGKAAGAGEVLATAVAPARPKIAGDDPEAER